MLAPAHAPAGTAFLFALAATPLLVAEELAFHERVRRTYRALARREPRRFVVIDAARDPDAVFADLEADLSRLLGKGAR